MEIHFLIVFLVRQVVDKIQEEFLNRKRCMEEWEEKLHNKMVFKYSE